VDYQGGTRDRHYDCSPGRCTAPMPRRFPSTGARYGWGPALPRRTWWLRVNRAGRAPGVLPSQPRVRPGLAMGEATGGRPVLGQGLSAEGDDAHRAHVLPRWRLRPSKSTSPQ